MESRWNDADAAALVEYYSNEEVHPDLSLRVYSTRLLGRDPALVLHGGGNTSVKLEKLDNYGDLTEVLCVKGSGWDMGDIEPAGLPAVNLFHLRRLQTLDNLSDEDMVAFQRSALLDAKSPNPSIETLLHAFLPHRFVDHTHSTAVLALTDQPDGEEICKDVFGERAALVPYVMPGFKLAKLASAIQQENPNVEGLILLKHGIFSFGDTARESYESMIRLVSIAESKIEESRTKTFISSGLLSESAPVAAVAPILRGLVSEALDRNEGLWRRQILEFRTSDLVLSYVNGAQIDRYACQGVVTPDHTIRTKNWPLIVPFPEIGDIEGFAQKAGEAVNRFIDNYHAYFERNNPTGENSKVELDPMPRVILVPGLGIFGLGRTSSDAKIVADIAESTIEVITDAESIGVFQPVGEADLFDIEYWSLEQAKLKKIRDKPFTGQVVLVTGAASGIGAATARTFYEQGAEVALIDVDEESLRKVAQDIGANVLSLGCDVTDKAAVRSAFDLTCKCFGGLDIVVSNAGAAWDGKIGDVADSALRASFELNFFAHQTVAKNATRIMRAQGMGGCLLFNASKQAVNPGPAFGPYGLPKASTLFLMRQYAIDYGEHGIRSNAVNADRVRTDIFGDGFLEQRAKARGLSVDEYLSGDNLLGREVKPTDVARAFLNLATAAKTTASVVTVDGGNIAAALR